MKAIMLAAGIGSRIAKNISNEHKCLLPIPRNKGASEQCPLIVSTINGLQKRGIQDITIITGYLHEQLEEALQNLEVECIYNPFYYLVNSIGSLWFAIQKIQEDDDLLILNADTFLEDELLTRIISSPINSKHPLLYIDSSKHAQADVKVNYKGTLLQNYGKDITETVMAESTDVFVVPKVLSNAFASQLHTLLAAKKHDTWWESALIEFQDSMPIMVSDIAGMFWSEIDFYEDYTAILQYLTSTN